MLKARDGQGFLALVISVGGILAAIGVVIAYLAISSVSGIYGYQSGVRAEAAASAGASDALLQLDRNPDFSNSYSIKVGTITAQVSVDQGAPSAGYATISSVASIGNSKKVVEVVASVDPVTSQVSVDSWDVVQ